MEVSLTLNGSNQSFDGEVIDVGELSTDGQVLSALSKETNEDLSGFVVDRLSSDVIKVRPQASFGENNL